MNVRTSAFGLALLLLAGACAAAPTSGPVPGANQAPKPAPTKTLVVVDRHEPIDLAPKILAQGGSWRTKRLFNADLALVDASGTTQPYLAEALPQLNTDSWRVFPDGRMETTYRLRPNLTWQDGEPLTAADFVFAWRVYTTVEGPFSSTPQDKMDSVEAMDPRTLLI